MLQGMHRSGTDWASPLSSITPWRVKKKQAEQTLGDPGQKQQNKKKHGNSTDGFSGPARIVPQADHSIQQESSDMSHWSTRPEALDNFHQFPGYAEPKRAILSGETISVPLFFGFHVELRWRNKTEKTNSNHRKKPIRTPSTEFHSPKCSPKTGAKMVFISYSDISSIAPSNFYAYLITRGWFQILRFHILGAMNPAMLMYSRVPPDGISSFSYSKIAICWGPPCLRNTPLAES